MKDHQTTEFINQPFLTKELVTSDPIAAFDVVPRWVQHLSFANPEDLEDIDLNVVLIVLGRKHKALVALSVSQFALLCELTRLGHSVATNSNFAKPHPRIYPKITYRDAMKDASPIARLFADAGPNESVSRIDERNDFRPENLKKIGAGKPRKEAIQVALFHAERLMNERKAGQTLPANFDEDGYLNNLKSLFAWSLDEANLPEVANDEQ